MSRIRRSSWTLFFLLKQVQNESRFFAALESFPSDCLKQQNMIKAPIVSTGFLHICRYINICVCIYSVHVYLCIHHIYRRGINTSFSICFIRNVCVHMESVYVCGIANWEILYRQMLYLL